MIALVLASLAATALILLIVVETLRARAQKKVKVRRNFPRRQPQLEDRVREAFHGPNEKYGEIFVSYTIWKRDQETRMELFAADPFAQLNEFTRCLIVRHLWRALERLASGSVVVVDSPPQMWSKAIDEKFQDQGIDPWRLSPSFGTASGGPQFVKE
jgi:hypothetical protein